MLWGSMVSTPGGRSFTGRVVSAHTLGPFSLFLFMVSNVAMFFSFSFCWIFISVGRWLYFI